MRALIIILAVLMPVPLYIAYRSLFRRRLGRNESVALDEAFKRVIKRNNLKPAEVVRFPNRLIAIDRDSGQLVLIVHRKGVTWEKCVSLEEISGCQVVKLVDEGNGYTRRVSLELSFGYGEKNLRFPFFDDSIDPVQDLGRRMKQSKYWQKKISFHRENALPRRAVLRLA